jgi:hypothetical protein
VYRYRDCAVNLPRRRGRAQGGLPHASASHSGSGHQPILQIAVLVDRLDPRPIHGQEFAPEKIETPAGAPRHAGDDRPVCDRVALRGDRLKGQPQECQHSAAPDGTRDCARRVLRLMKLL